MVQYILSILSISFLAFTAAIADDIVDDADCFPTGYVFSSEATNDTTDFNDAKCFSDGFLFGTATAAYQVEGGWNASHRTPSIWDAWCRDNVNVSCANVADDFYHRYAQDIELMKNEHMNSFRFSISWSRVMNWDESTGRMAPNEPGIAFYHSMIDELIKNGIIPILTIYHWDLPLELHEKLDPPGWLNSEIQSHFVEYADLMFREYGSKVNYWATFNEPWTFVYMGYNAGLAAPGLKNSSTDAYTAAHNVILSHGKAVQSFRALQVNQVIPCSAKIGIVLNADFGYPLNASDPVDIAAAERKMKFVAGWFLSPITEGKYPDVMRQRAGDNLPTFTNEELAYVLGSYDMLMLNHYGSKLTTDCNSTMSAMPCDTLPIGWQRDAGFDDSRMPVGARPSSIDEETGEFNCPWFSAYPPGYLEAIKWTHAHDPEAPLLLTENGWCGNNTINNMDQLWYHQEYLAQVHKAIHEEGINVIGYTAWSFEDNYEWGSFKPRFGLHHIEYPSEVGSKVGYTPLEKDLKRTPRPAANWLASVAKSRCIVPSNSSEWITVVSSDANGDDSDWNIKLLMVILSVAIVSGVAFAFQRFRNQAVNEEATPLL